MEKLLPTTRSQNRERFPQIKCEHRFGESSLLQEEVVHQKVKVNHLLMNTDSSHALGNIHAQYGNWEKLNSDKVILGLIKDGVTIDFHTIPRCLRTEPLCNLSRTQRGAVTCELKHLLSLGIISETTYHQDKYISDVFTTEKPDHPLRMILNMKKLNEFVRHIHFNMESLNDVLCLI